MSKIAFHFLVVSAALILVEPIRAQQRVGFVGGLNFANVVGELDSEKFDSSTRTVFGLGGVLDLALSKQIGLRLEPMYLQKGGTTEDFEIDDFGLFESTIKLTYFEVPVFLKLAVESGSSTQLYFLAGPTVGLVLSSNLAVDTEEFTGLIDTLDLTNFIDFGLGFGAGLSLELGRQAIFLEARYAVDLNNGVDPGKATGRAMDRDFDLEFLGQGDNLKSRAIQIMVGMTFPFGEY